MTDEELALGVLEHAAAPEVPTEEEMAALLAALSEATPAPARRRWPAGLAAAALVLAVGFGTLWGQDWTYRSRARVLVEPMASGAEPEGYLRSERIARLALARLGVRRLPGDTSERVSARRNVVRFVEGLSVVRRGTTRIVEVAFESPDPVFAARAANGAVEAYIEDSRRRSSGVRDQSARKLRGRERTLRPLVQQAREKAEAYAAAHGAELAGEEALRARARRVSSALQVVREGGVPDGAEGAVIRDLERQLGEVESRLKSLRAIYADTHPKLVPLVARRGHLAARIETERARKVADLEARSRRVAGLLEQAGRTRARLEMLRQKADALERARRALLQRVEEIETQTLVSRSEETIWVIDRARPARWPHSPNLWWRVSGIVGLAVVVFLAVCRRLRAPGVPTTLALIGALCAHAEVIRLLA